MEKFVLDTNLFFNLEIKSGLGENPKTIFITISQMAQKLKQTQKAEFYMPPKIVDECLTFVNRNESYVKDFLSVIIIKSPDVSSLQFKAPVFYQLVDEIRERSYRGLRIGEELIEQAGKKMLGKPDDMAKIEYQKTIGELVTKLRERYRQATRFNFLDSVADLDLISLSKELDGFLVSSDEGVLRWGRIFGIKELPADLFQKRLLSLLPHQA